MGACSRRASPGIGRCNPRLRSEMTEHGKSSGRPRPERWIREDAAARLQDLVPNLAGLRFEFSETSGERRVLDSTRIQHVIVPRAAALFEVACSDPGCRDGGFDITVEVLRALRHESSEFSGEACCFGSIGERPCERVLRFRAVAEWARQRDESGQAARSR